MARRGSKTAAQEARIQQERARVYRARAQWNADRASRRVRDNVIAGTAGALLIIGCFVSQGVHAAVTAPAPEPEPTVTTPVPSPEETGDTEAPEEGTPEEEAPEGQDDEGDGSEDSDADAGDDENPAP